MKLALRNRTHVSIAAVVALLASIFGIWLWSTPQTQRTSGTLDDHDCNSVFSVARTDPTTDSLASPTRLEYFQSFSSGAFFGKIEDYHSSNATSFSSLIDELMKNGDIQTYEHLSAEVCLFNEDLLNPEGGATLRYFVEHYYCTNECQTGTYSIRVDLKSDGYFVGYREVSKWE